MLGIFLVLRVKGGGGLGTLFNSLFQKELNVWTVRIADNL